MAPVITRLVALSALVSVGLSLPTVQTNEVDDCRLGRDERIALQRAMPTEAGLPSNSNVTLVYATVGVGHQNYTCSGTTYVQAGTGDGALAFLYDATELFYYNEGAMSQLPAERLDRFLRDGQSQSRTNTEPQLRLIGEHFFDASFVPKFNLYGASRPRYLVAAKDAAAAAPSSNDIDWLYLGQNTGVSGTVGLNSVYRVVTAGGVPPASCSTSGSQISVPYAAEYWFFN